MSGAHEPYVVIVCGGRNYRDRSAVFGALDALRQRILPGTMLVIHGAADGADALAAEWAEVMGVPDLPFPAAWDDLTGRRVALRRRSDGTLYNAAAGAIRNQRMIDEGKPDLVMVFPGNQGTDDMARRAEKAKIETIWPAGRRPGPRRGAA